MAYLVIENSKFKSELLKQIEAGEKLIAQTKDKLDFFTIGSISGDADDWDDYNIELLKQSFDVAENDYVKEYIKIGKLSFEEAEEEGDGILMSVSYVVSRCRDSLKSLYKRADLIKVISQGKVVENKLPNDLKLKNEVFIVHGHDDISKTKTARYLTQLGLKPIILNEQANSGKTIIEKIEEYSNVGFGIILYTPCDVGSKHGDEKNIRYRARQNVVFEHGYLVGKIGRSNVCALVKGNIEIPNDISGVVYINMDNEEAWHLKLAKELRNSGYNVDMNKL